MIELEQVQKRYDAQPETAPAIAGVSLHVRAGESLAIMGPSGSGKSTLLNLIGLLTTPTSGKVLLAGEEAAHLSPRHKAAMRNRLIGFIFQQYGLLPDLTVWENVELPLLYGQVRRGRGERVRSALEAVGLLALARRRPAQLSGGQQQRVAIARALVTEAPIILADEPTGALDSTTGTQVLDQLSTLHASGRTLLIVTHSAEVARRCQRIIQMRDGRIGEEE